MTRPWMPALALIAFLCALPAQASNSLCIGNDCLPKIVLVDPTTGNPINSGGTLAAPLTGQVKIATTGTAVPLPSLVLANGIVVKSKPTNNATGATVGGASVTTTTDGTGNGYALAPGEGVSIAVPNANTVYVNGTAGDVFFFAGN